MYFNDYIKNLSNDSLRTAQWFGKILAKIINNQSIVHTFGAKNYQSTIPRTQDRAESLNHHINEICSKDMLAFTV